jgi:ankyrin repeat protein
MGTGEPREPQTFTLEQRLRDAVERGDRATIEKALERGADLGSKDELGRTVVLLATHFAGDLELVKWLQAKGAPLDVPDVNGRTALHFAAEDGRLDLVRWLVEQGAEVDRRDGQKRTALFLAAVNARDDVVAFLADRRATIDVQDQFGDTPLMLACAKGLDSTAALLLARGADPTLRDQEGRTASERAAPEAKRCRKPA